MRYKGVICFSAVDWNFLRQRVHYLMEGLAAAGLKILFVENTGVRSPGLGDLPRILNRLGNAAGRARLEKPPAGIEIFSPVAVPLPYNRPAVLYNKRYIFSRIKSFLASNNLTPPEVIFWTYLATPVVLELMRCLPWGAKVYDVVSDPKFIEPRLEPYERKLTGLSNFTLFASATLHDKYRESTKNPVLFKDGFNTEIFGENEVSSLISGLPRPRFLYIGGLNKKIRIEDLTMLAGYFEKGSVVLVGPRSADFKLPPCGNIYVFPQCACYGDLAGFLKYSDAGLIPYLPDDYSGAMHPAKLNEYLVSGLPVVATATPELARLADLWGEGFLYLYNLPDQIKGTAEKALSENSQALRNKRQNFVQTNTWDRRIEEMLNILEQRRRG